LQCETKPHLSESMHQNVNFGSNLGVDFQVWKRRKSSFSNLMLYAILSFSSHKRRIKKIPLKFIECQWIETSIKLLKENKKKDTKVSQNGPLMWQMPYIPRVPVVCKRISATWPFSVVNLALKKLTCELSQCQVPMYGTENICHTCGFLSVFFVFFFIDRVWLLFTAIIWMSASVTFKKKKKSHNFSFCGPKKKDWKWW